MMVLYLLEYSVKTDHQVKAIHEQSNSHKDNQRQLIIAQRFPRRAFIGPKRTRRPRDTAVPRNSRWTGTWNGGSEEIVETK
jgi:hypothetical protein